jgi:hypothetical protein
MVRKDSPGSRDAHSASRGKRLGGYLVEAGLLTPAQVDVVLNDQKMTGMRFGEILAARGWVKQQTIEYFMQKVILPEQEAISQPHQSAHSQSATDLDRAGRQRLANPNAASRSPLPPPLSNESRQPTRRDAPISKPLPSVPSKDDDVGWVG